MTIKKFINCNLNDFKLLIATASTANLGQFVADLIVNSLKLEKFAQIFHAAIPPLIGPSAFEYASKDITTACEMFICVKEKFLVLLIRTPVTASFLSDLIAEIIQFAKDESIKEIVQLSSAFSSEQHFIGCNPFEYLANEYFSLDENLQAKFNKSSIEKIHGSGIALKLHEQATINQIPSIILYKFTSEGENTLESVDYSAKICGYILDSNTKFDVKIPTSWNHLFGFNVNSEIY